MSPITVTFSVPIAAAPLPSTKRNISSSSRLRARAQAPPATPKSRSAGTRIFFRPQRSERTPSTGVSTIPGSAKTVMSSPTCPLETPNSCTIPGNAGVTLETPRTDIRPPRQPTRVAARRRGLHAGGAQDGQQGDAPEHVRVVVLVDLPDPAVSLRRRGHERRMYQPRAGPTACPHTTQPSSFGLWNRGVSGLL